MPVPPDWCRGFGSSNPATDVETIAMAAHSLKEIGIQGVKLHQHSRKS